MSQTPIAFLSYVNLNDQHDYGDLTQFRERLSGEVRFLTGEAFDIFQDRKDIVLGQPWQERINESLDAVTFLIPIITPSFFKSDACRAEFEHFLKREEELGRSDLILPVYYATCPVLKDKEKLKHDPLAQIIAARQYADWRELRHEPFTSPQLRKAITKIAEQIVAALERSYLDASRAAAARPASKRPEKESDKAASQSNTFQSSGGEQSIAQGERAIGTQISYFGPQVLPPDKPKSKPVVRKALVAAAFMSVVMFAATYYSGQSNNQTNAVAPSIKSKTQPKPAAKTELPTVVVDQPVKAEMPPKTVAKRATSATVETVKQTKVEKPPVNYTDNSVEDKHDQDIRSGLFRKSYAVVIGISSYQNHSAWKTLDNTENDAKAMGDFLLEQGFNVQTFVGREATKSNIVAYLEDTLAPRLTRDDRFVFYFSGHGNTRQLGGSDRGYLIPYDGDIEKASTWIGMEQLQELSGKLGIARHQLFILDSCFGGLFATKGALSITSEGIPNYIKEITSHRARQYLTAGGTNQATPASSNLDGYRAYSYYTAYLLKGLREGVADTYPDGFITASELDAYLGAAASTNYNSPRGGNFPGHEQGNFVFRSPKPAQIKMSDPVPAVPTKGNKKEEHLIQQPDPAPHRRKHQMITVHPKYVVDSAQICTAVQIPVDEWEQILKALDIQVYDTAKAEGQQNR